MCMVPVTGALFGLALARARSVGGRALYTTDCSHYHPVRAGKLGVLAMVTRRKFIIVGSAAAGTLALSANPASADSPSPDDRVDGSYAAVVQSADGARATVVPVNGGDPATLPLSGFPTGIIPRPGELVAVDTTGPDGSQIWPLVDTTSVPPSESLSAGEQVSASDYEFVVLPQTVMSDGEGNRHAFVTKPGASFDEQRRALAVVYRPPLEEA